MITWVKGDEHDYYEDRPYQDGEARAQLGKGKDGHYQGFIFCDASKEFETPKFKTAGEVRAYCNAAFRRLKRQGAFEPFVPWVGGDEHYFAGCDPACPSTSPAQARIEVIGASRYRIVLYNSARENCAPSTTYRTKKAARTAAITLAKPMVELMFLRGELSCSRSEDDY